jgi:hypothetical protein
VKKKKKNNKKKRNTMGFLEGLLEMPVPSQGHYGFHSFPVVD